MNTLIAISLEFSHSLLQRTSLGDPHPLQMGTHTNTFESRCWPYLDTFSKTSNGGIVLIFELLALFRGVSNDMDIVIELANLHRLTLLRQKPAAVLDSKRTLIHLIGNDVS
jgi:hypothetical protein